MFLHAPTLDPKAGHTSKCHLQCLQQEEQGKKGGTG